MAVKRKSAFHLGAEWTAHLQGIQMYQITTLGIVLPIHTLNTWAIVRLAHNWTQKQMQVCRWSNQKLNILRYCAECWANLMCPIFNQCTAFYDACSILRSNRIWLWGRQPIVGYYSVSCFNVIFCMGLEKMASVVQCLWNVSYPREVYDVKYVSEKCIFYVRGKYILLKVKLC